MPLETIGGIADIRLRPCDATRLHLDVPVTGMRKTLLAGQMDTHWPLPREGAGDDSRFS